MDRQNHGPGSFHLKITFCVKSNSHTWNKGDSRPRHLQGKGAFTGLVRQAWGFLSLALCNLANFDHLCPTKYIHYDFTRI